MLAVLPLAAPRERGGSRGNGLVVGDRFSSFAFNLVVARTNTPVLFGCWHEAWVYFLSFKISPEYLISTGYHPDATLEINVLCKEATFCGVSTFSLKT